MTKHARASRAPHENALTKRQTATQQTTNRFNFNTKTFSFLKKENQKKHTAPEHPRTIPFLKKNPTKTQITPRQTKRASQTLRKTIQNLQIIIPQNEHFFFRFGKSKTYWRVSP